MDSLDGNVASAEALSAALLTMEDEIVRDAEAAYATAVELERQASALGDGALIARARLRRISMLQRTGDVAGAAEQIGDIHAWAAGHGDQRLRARVHLVWASIARQSGDAATFLEHALSAVELVDDTATAPMQVRHRLMLADALAENGDMDAARVRFGQAEARARELQQWEWLTLVLNNWAWAESAAGDFPRAREVAGRLQEDAAAHGFGLDPAQLDTIGNIQIENGEYVQAEQTMQECIARYEAGENEDADDLAEYLLTLARVQRGLGATSRAQASLDRSRTVCAERGLHGVLARVHQEQAELHAARGERAEAFAAHKAFLAARESLRSPQRESEAQTRQVMFETAEAREEAERFRDQARRDPLTGLPNRRYLDEVLPTLAAGPDLTLVIARIEDFKHISEVLSREDGDRVLVQVARLLETGLAAVAPEGFAARLDGDQFMLVLPATPTAAAATLLDGIQQAVSDHDWHDMTNGLPVTISINPAVAHTGVPLAARDR